MMLSHVTPEFSHLATAFTPDERRQIAPKVCAWALPGQPVRFSGIDQL
jgi:hypothetical protein